VEPLALAVDAHQRETQSSNVGTTGKAAINKVKDKRPYTNSPWAKFTPEERSKEMIRRRKVAKRNKELKAAGKPIRKPWKRSGESMEKQKIYVARAAAKKARAVAQALGKPLPPMPPLPGEEA
jgi:hypothetical protein